MKSRGARLLDAIPFGGPYQFLESQSGAIYVFDSLQSDNGVNQPNRQLWYYASSITYPDGEVISFTYDKATYTGSSNPINHRLTRMTSNLGYYIAFTYQGSDVNQNGWQALQTARLYRSTDPSTILDQLSFASNGTTTDNLGRVYTCTGCNNSIRAEVELASVSMTLPTESSAQITASSMQVPSTSKFIVSSVVRDGVTWSYTYGNLRTKPAPQEYTFDYVQVTGPAGYSVRYNINSLIGGGPNLIASVVDPINRTTSYSYDGFMRPVQITSPEGNYVQIGYDTFGNITSKVSQPKAGSGLAAITETSGIDTAACNSNPVLCFRPTWYKDGLNRQTDHVYDSEGRLIQRTDPADAAGVRRVTYLTYTTSFTAPTEVRVCGLTTTCGTTAELKTRYTYVGNTALPATSTVVDSAAGTSITTTYTYDNLGRLTVEDGPLAGLGDAKYFRYDAVGRKTWEIGPANADGTRPATRTTYRPADNKVTLAETGTIPDATSATLTVITRSATSHDARRNPIQVATAGGASGPVQTVRSASHDDRGQQLCETVRMNLASLPTDACVLGTQGTQGPDRITRRLYDNAGQLLQVQKAYGTPLQQNYVTYSYTGNGKQASVTDANGSLATLAYDGHDRLLRWSFPSKTTVGQASTTDYEQYGYDAAGNRTSLRKRDGVTLTYAYDGLNRVTVKTVPTSASGVSGYSVHSGYDMRGLQTYARFGSIYGEGVNFGYDGHGRQTVSNITLGGNSRTLNYQYDVAGNRTRVTHPDAKRFDMTYDNGGRMASATWTNPGWGTATPTSFIHDNLGRRLTTQFPLSDGRSTYDSIGRLASLGRYFGNGVGNVATTFGYNPASQITSLGRSNDDYRHAGYVTSDRTYAANGLNQYAAVAGTAYSYDANGNLTSDGTYTYTYDAENRLVASSRSGGTTLAYDPLGRLWRTSSPNVGTTQFLYDGDRLAVEYDDAGAIRRRHAWGPGVDEPILQDEGSALDCTGTRFLHTDHQGSIIATANCSGTRLNVNTHDEYGVPAAGNANWGRFQYTGQAWIPELGMYYYKARIYSPMLGRFMQTDPIGYEDQINLYAYVGNDPVNGRDPSGLYECTDGKNCDAVKEGIKEIREAKTFYSTPKTGSLIARNAGMAQALGRVLDALGIKNDGGVNIEDGPTQDPTGRGEFSKESNTITLNTDVIRRTGGSLGSTLAHEGQHYRQKNETFLFRNQEEIRPLGMNYAVDFAQGKVPSGLSGHDYVRDRWMGPYCKLPAYMCSPAFNQVWNIEAYKPWR